MVPVQQNMTFIAHLQLTFSHKSYLQEARALQLPAMIGAAMPILPSHMLTSSNIEDRCTFHFCNFFAAKVPFVDHCIDLKKRHTHIYFEILAYHEIYWIFHDVTEQLGDSPRLIGMAKAKVGLIAKLAQFFIEKCMRTSI